MHGFIGILTYDPGGVSNIRFLHNISVTPSIQAYAYLDMVAKYMTTYHCWSFGEKACLLPNEDDKYTERYGDSSNIQITFELVELLLWPLILNSTSSITMRDGVGLCFLSYDSIMILENSCSFDYSWTQIDSHPKISSC